MLLQAYKITAHQYDKLQSNIEFQSGKILLFHNNYNCNIKSNTIHLNNIKINNHKNTKNKNFIVNQDSDVESP